jgi:hypothetical protein
LRARAAFPVAVAAALLVAAPSYAQSPMTLDVGAPAPALQVGPVLQDGALESAVRSGLPLRMRFRVELWRDELFDDLVRQVEWSAIVAYEPLERRFLTGVIQDDTLEAYATWPEARAAVEREYALGIGPSRSGRYYYIATMEIETLSLSDLDELERWLRGELEPAVRSGGSVGGAIGTGVKRLFIRILGLPARRYEVRSDPFILP